MNLRAKLATVLVVVLGPLLAMAQWDGGTNAINTLNGNVSNASGVGTPIMLGLLGLFLGVGIVVKFIRKGKAG